MQVFSPGARVLELGGGNNPRFHPNADVRWLPEVDIPGVDFNYPLPIPSGQYDGVYASYVLEHLSWRKVRLFISETHRLLKPGGIAVFITANLLEQCRALVVAPAWNDDLICMVFGDQDYEANTHRSGFSPEYATRLFKEAGFYEVKIDPIRTQAGPTDMVVIAVRSKARVEVS